MTPSQIKKTRFVRHTLTGRVGRVVSVSKTGDGRKVMIVRVCVWKVRKQGKGQTYETTTQWTSDPLEKATQKEYMDQKKEVQAGGRKFQKAVRRFLSDEPLWGSDDLKILPAEFWIGKTPDREPDVEDEEPGMEMWWKRKVDGSWKRRDDD